MIENILYIGVFVLITLGYLVCMLILHRTAMRKIREVEGGCNSQYILMYKALVDCGLLKKVYNKHGELTGFDVVSPNKKESKR